MSELLVIGDITSDMRRRLASRFALHDRKYVDDAWLDSNGHKITHVSTDGHLGAPADLMAKLPNVQMIASYGVGYDAIDTDMAVSRGIPVSHTPDVLNEEVASTTLMLMLTLYRNFRFDEAHARSGNWTRDGNAPLSRSADKRTVGILGMGRIGQAIARKLQALNATILYHTRSEKDVPYTYVADLTEMAKQCDVLVCITPGGPATRHLVDKSVIDALGPEGMLINVSRGSVVDEDALVKALQDGRLGSAGLDVFEKEPKIPAALCEMNNVVLLPHVGSATIETRKAMGDLVVDNLISHLETGKVLTSVPETAHLKK